VICQRCEDAEALVGDDLCEACQEDIIEQEEAEYARQLQEELLWIEQEFNL